MGCCSSNIDIPVNYFTKKREWIGRDSKIKSDAVIGNLCKSKDCCEDKTSAAAITIIILLILGLISYIFFFNGGLR